MSTLTLAEMKLAVITSLAITKSNQGTAASLAGTKFLSGKGAIGTLLPTLSAHGKLQAEFTCTVPGCKELHTRERSDWHQVGECRTHRAGKSGSHSTTKSTSKPSNKTPAEQLAALEAQLAAMKAVIAQRAEVEELNKVIYGK
jgi:Tfp pilus assembly protein FimV